MGFDRSGDLDEHALLRALIDAMPDHIYVKDTEGRFLLVNQAFLPDVGAKSLDDLLGKTDRDLFPPQLAAVLMDAERHILETGEPQVNREEEVQFRGTGTRFWKLTTKFPFRDRQGRLAGIVGISRDITARKQLEDELARHRSHLEDLVRERTAELQNERNLLRTLMDVMPDSIYIKDKEHRFLMVSKKVLESHALSSQDEILGKTDKDFFPPAQAQVFFDDEDAILGSGQALVNREEPGPGYGTGRRVWHLSTKVPYRDHQGQIVGLMGISRDITELEQSRERQKALNDELQVANNALRSSLESLEVTQAQLIRTEKLAALGELVGGIAHEINTPLGAIVSSYQTFGGLFESVLTGFPGFQLSWDADDRPVCESLVNRALHPPPLDYSATVHRAERKVLSEVFAGLGIADASRVAELLVELGLSAPPAALVRILAGPQGPELVSWVDQIYSLARAHQVIAIATGKMVKTIDALQHYLTSDPTREKRAIDLRYEVDTVLALHRGQTRGHVTIVRNYQEVPPVWGEKDTLNRVWGGLIGQALSSMGYEGTLDISIFLAGDQTGFSVTHKTGAPSEETARVLAVVKAAVESHDGILTIETTGDKTTITVLLPPTK